MLRKIVALEKIFSTCETVFHSCPVTLHQNTESGTKYMSVNCFTLKMKLEDMNRRLNEALDTDLFEESESEFNEFQAEVDSFERELEEISEFRQDHLQLSELKKIGAIQKKIRQVKNGYNFYDPEYERSVMFPNGEDEEEDDFFI